MELITELDHQECQRGEREMASREEALKAFPIGTQIRREFADIRGRRKAFVGEVYNFKNPPWRVSYQDGDWDEANRQEFKRGKDMAILSVSIRRPR